jgi:hypothetical protein
MIEVYVIYSRPTDYPTEPFVLRLHVIEGRGKQRSIKPTEWVRTGPTLEEMRRFIPPGTTRYDRHPDDEPQIVEWWA